MPFRVLAIVVRFHGEIFSNSVEKKKCIKIKIDSGSYRVGLSVSINFFNEKKSN